MKRESGKSRSWSKWAALTALLGFTAVSFAAGCALGALAQMAAGRAVDIAGWGGGLGLLGFFAGALFLIRYEPVKREI